MAKQSEVDKLVVQLESKEKALGEARKGLFRIIDTDPVTFLNGPAGSGQKMPIVEAFEYVQSLADRTVIKMSDAEAGNEKV